MSLEDLRREPTVYLLPECENEEKTRECVEEVVDLCDDPLLQEEI